MQKYNYKINKVAVGFDYNEKKETNILNSFYVVAQGQAEYNLPSFYGFTDVKLNFSTDSIAGYGKNVYSDNGLVYLSATLPLNSMGNSQEDERAISDACIDFKLGQFGTKSLTVGGNSSDHTERIKLSNDKAEVMNGFEMEIKNNCDGDMSATWFKGTSDSPNQTDDAVVKTAASAWINGATNTIAIDATKNKALLARLKKGDKIRAYNATSGVSEPLYGVGVVISHTGGVITFTPSQMTVQTGCLVQTTLAAGFFEIPIDGADTATLVAGKAIYAHDAVPSTLTMISTQYLGASTQTGVVAHLTEDLKFNTKTATAATDGDTIYQSSGEHFTTLPAVDSKITFEFQNPEGKVDNNIDGFRIKFKLSKYGCIGYESFDNKDRVSGVVTKNETTSVFLGMDKSSDLDQNSRSYEDLLSKLSVDYLESKRGTNKTKISAIQYKLSDDISLMYGQKKSDLKKKSDIYGMNYKMTAGDSDVLLKIRGQSEADGKDNNKLQIQMELPTNLIDYTQE